MTKKPTRRRERKPAAAGFDAQDLDRLRALAAARAAAVEGLRRARRRLQKAESSLQTAEVALETEGQRLGVLPEAEGTARSPQPPGPAAGFEAVRSAKGFEAAEEAQPTRAATLTFSDFLSGVSEAMIAAQQRLDLQTEAYLAGSSSPRPLPTLFRLPRLEAEVKFALETEGRNKLNLVFYSSSSAAKSLQQHSISFELVAVPPPPESRLAPGEYRPLLPRLELVHERAERLTMLGAMLDLKQVAVPLGLNQGDAAAQHPEVALWRFVRPKASKPADDLFLVGRGIAAAPLARLVLVQVRRSPMPAGGPGQPVVTAVQPLASGPVETWLAGFLEDVGARQTEILTGQAA